MTNPAIPALTAAAPDPLHKHRLDLNAIENGKWVDIGGDRWLIARVGCLATGKARAEAMAEIGLAPDAEIPAHQADRVQGYIFAHVIIRAVKFADSDARYLPDMGLRIWSDPELRELRDTIMNECQGDYRQAATAKAAILGN